MHGAYWLGTRPHFYILRAGVHQRSFYCSTGETVLLL